jgi:hypothetical protein
LSMGYWVLLYFDVGIVLALNGRCTRVTLLWGRSRDDAIITAL